MAGNAFNGSAKWIWSSEGCWGKQPAQDPYRVRYFRRVFDAPTADCQLLVHVSADSRYILWCNGIRVGRGPAKGDLAHQFYDSIDLTPHLLQGCNVLAVQVISYTDSWPAARFGGGLGSVMTATGALIVDAELCDRQGQSCETLHTDSGWRVLIDSAYNHLPSSMHFGAYVGMGESFDSVGYPWGWQSADYDDGSWQQATEIERGFTTATYLNASLPYRLLPRIIPPLEETDSQRFSQVYGQGEAGEDWDGLIQGEAGLTIGPNSQVHVGLDAGAMTTGYPVLAVQQGAGSEIKLTYGEAQWNQGKKGNRNDLTWGKLDGISDTYRPSGAEESWEPFHWRAFRLIEVDVATGDEPLTISAFTYRFTAYPGAATASFECSDPTLNKIWDVGLRTARLCAHETYENSPTYEQFQCAGDAQIQTLISYVTSGDPRLARQAMNHFDWSRTFEGITSGRYPARVSQIMPFWSLYWILMVHDYYWFTGDLEGAKEHLDGIASVLRWFERLIGSSGLVERVPYCCFADWSPEWYDDEYGPGVPPGIKAGPSALINFLFAYCLDTATALYLVAGQGVHITGFRAQAARIREHADQHFWSDEQGLYYDRPGGPEVSQLTNAWAILCGAASASKTNRILRRLPDDPSLCKAGFLGLFHVFRALSKAGAYDKVFELMAPWRHMIKAGLTTWAETLDVETTRSDCHGWSCAPTYELATKVLGVQPAAPGFSRVLIRPFPGYLTRAKGSIPTPHGDVQVAWNVQGSRFVLEGQLPSDVPATVILPGGEQAEFSGGSFRLGTEIAPRK